MYLRVTRRTNRNGSVVEYYQLAESVWDPERQQPRARIVHNFGRADKVDPEDLKKLARSINRVCNQGIDVPEELAGTDELPKINIEWSRPFGTSYVVEALWEELGIGPLLRGLVAGGKGRRKKAPHERALFAMVANRLAEPCSKLACHEVWIAERVYLPDAEELTLDQLYLAMDFLEDHVDEVEREVFFQTADLLNADVDLIFWDTTTVYFEVDEEDEVTEHHHGRDYEPLRKRGHNKERRDGDPQVVVGLALTRDGLPVRSWVFPGNTVDATTVAKVKEDLRGWRLNRSVIVGDAGMDSFDNRKALTKGLGRYILAMPMAKLKEVQQKVLTRGGRFTKVNDRLQVKQVVVGEGEGRRRYIVCRNLKEAARQKHHREDILAGLRLELEALGRNEEDHPKRACELLASKRYGRYLRKTEAGGLRIDAAAVRRAQKMDGKYVLLTNDDTLTKQDVATGYKAMMIIESCFRRMKTTGLRIRPVYHWTPHRIISHVKLCVLALLIQRVVEIRCQDTWRTIRTALEQISAVKYRFGKRSIVQTSNPRPEAVDILKSLGISGPKRILSLSK
jgi:transposase